MRAPPAAVDLHDRRIAVTACRTGSMIDSGTSST